MRLGAGSGGWNRRVWRLAFPIILSNISVPLLGAVDTAVVGHLPEPYYLGAVAVGAMIFNFIYWGFGFLRMGTTGLTAQAYGAGDVDEVRATAARAMVIGMVGAAALLAVQTPVAWAAFGIVDASSEVESLAREYYQVRIFGAPATLANYVFLGWFLGLQNARAALLIQVWMNGLNIVLDIVFVVWLGWGVMGVALATAIAEYSALIPAFWMAAGTLRRLGGTFRADRILSGERLRRALALNLDIFIRTVCLVFAFAYFTAQSARMGDVTLAANAVMMNFVTFTAHGLDGFAHAVQALAGGAVGAGDRLAFRSAVRISTGWAAVVAVACTAVYAGLGGVIIDLLTGLAAVRAEAVSLLPWVVALPVIAIWAYLLDGVFIGATRGAAMRNAMIVSVAIYLAMCAVFVPLWGNHGLWLALSVFMAVRGLTLGLRYPALERSIGG